MSEDVRIIFVDFVGFERTVKVVSYAKGLASTVNHPIAKAIYNMDDRIEVANIKKVKEFEDFGALGEIEGEKVLLGNERIMLENNISLKGETKNKVFLAINSQVQAVFRLAE